MCTCSSVRRLDGDEAAEFATTRLTCFEREFGRQRHGDYGCPECGASWVLDFPLRHWSPDHRGPARLLQLPLAPTDPPVGGPPG